MNNDNEDWFGDMLIILGQVWCMVWGILAAWKLLLEPILHKLMGI